MKRTLTIISALLISFSAFAQHIDPLKELAADPRKAYGTDYPYLFGETQIAKAPKGYKPFYISTYARHGSRYYWNNSLYPALDTLLSAADAQNKLTAEGKAFYQRFLDAKDELMTGISELTQLGWDQHQQIARTMYNRFPDVFKKGGHINAISSLSGRCVLSMSAFCEELVQCNPKLEIREQSSRFTLNSVVPDDAENPLRQKYISSRPRYESSSVKIPRDPDFYNNIISRVFTSTEGLPGNVNSMAGNLVNLYTSLPNIDHEGMMGNIITDQELAAQWESSNLGSYTWVFSARNKMIPVLEDILDKAEAAVDGTGGDVATLRFGHDSCLGPLTALMGINGANLDPEDPYEVKNCYQSWETCKASNMQLVFYRDKKGNVIVRCLLNGSDASLPVKTDMYPFYEWSDFQSYYSALCKSVQPVK